MKHTLSLLTALLLVPLAALRAGELHAATIGDWSGERTVCRPIPLGDVRLGGFLGMHVDANNHASIPAGIKSAIPTAFEARGRGEDPPAACRRLATDTDLFKWLEGACYAVTYDPSLSEIAGAVERYAGLLARLQDKDGYLGTRLSPARPFDEKVWHDLYCAGHFIEAAVAHHKATGKRTLLDAACRLADFYARARDAGHPYFRDVGSREHPEIEPALVRLYRATGERRYLDFASAITRMSRLGPTLADVRAGGGGSRHAVRLCYLLTGAAELLIETGEREFERPLPSLWNEIVSTRMYPTGGIGYNEIVPAAPFDLPQCLEGNPNRDIAETCASVSLMMFSWRMHAITGESRFFDAIETILYNHYLGAVSSDHLGIFYYNPLRRVGDMTGRTDHGGNPVRRTVLPNLHSTSCCFPNSWRFFCQLPEYVFSANRDGVLVNLFTDAVARHRLPDGTTVRIEMQTRYPHEGTVTVRVIPDKPSRFSLGLRVPAWCDAAQVAVTGEPRSQAKPGSYFRIARTWQAGDEVLLDMPMKPAPIFGQPQSVAVRGQVAFRRGPIVYCLERQDAAGLDPARAVVLVDRNDPSRTIGAEDRPELGFCVLKVRAFEGSAPASSTVASPPQTSSESVKEVSLVPFYFRANREPDTRWVTFLPYVASPCQMACPVANASVAAAEETLPPLKDGKAPQTFEELWAGYDPRKEPLETEVLKEWEEDGVVLRVVRLRIGVFKGQKAMLAGVYGFPKGARKLPGLLQIHGGGQYADYKAPLTNAKRGYATLSIAWAGRISAPGYSVNPGVVALFWAGKTNDPQYRITTDWGALDAYHAPCRNPKNEFGSVAPQPWTLDSVESPRNNPWFLCTLAARRALTFLEQQPEVDPSRLGVYGHSMGGKLTVMTIGSDSRVKAAAPSCGGISNRPTDNALYAATIADGVYLKRIVCPIVFLSPANDFHGHINDLEKSLGEIQSAAWRVTCAAHHNHQDTEPFQVAGPLWFDQHLKGTFNWPKTPEATLTLKTANGVPSFSVKPDLAKTPLSVDIFYTQQGKPDGEKDSMSNTIARFWHHAPARRSGDAWTAELPVLDMERPLWAYANVLYPLETPVTAAGYYYGAFTAATFNVSSVLRIASPAQLKADGVKATDNPSLTIESFVGDWPKEWFTYDLTGRWPRRTHKLYDPKWKASAGAKLALDVRCERPNKLVVGLDDAAAEVALNGGAQWQGVVLAPGDFKNAEEKALADWTGIRELRLYDCETLVARGGGKKGKQQRIGAPWQGAAPEFRNLRWMEGGSR